MPLNDLSLAQLKALADDLASLTKVGQSLSPLNPIFDLTPGQPTRITLDQVMPEVSALSDRDQWLAIQAAILASNGSPTPSPEAAPDAPGEVAQAEPAPEPVEPPAVEGQAGGTLSAEPSRPDDAAAPPPAVAKASPPPLAEAASPEATAESGGGQAMAAAAPPASSVPGTASALAATTGQKLWTEIEDAQLVDLVARGVVHKGLSKKAAIADAAQELGRPEQAAQFRVYHKVKARIDESITALALAQAQTEIPETTPSPDRSPETASVGDDGDAAVGGHSPAAVQEPNLNVDKLRQARDQLQSAEVDDEEIERLAEVTPPEEIERIADALADPLQAHIAGLPYRDGWTMERDAEFLELKGLGWNENEIALEMKLQAHLLRPRLDLLTGAYQDDKGKLQRRFGHVEVFAALQARLTGKAA